MDSPCSAIGIQTGYGLEDLWVEVLQDLHMHSPIHSHGAASLTLYGAERHWRDPKVLGHSIVSQQFMEPEGSIPNSQELSTCPYPDPDQSSPHHPIPPLQDPS
jgi:hypothetical protein